MGEVARLSNAVVQRLADGSSPGKASSGDALANDWKHDEQAEFEPEEDQREEQKETSSQAPPESLSVADGRDRRPEDAEMSIEKRAPEEGWSAEDWEDARAVAVGGIADAVRSATTSPRNTSNPMSPQSSTEQHSQGVNLDAGSAQTSPLRPMALSEAGAPRADGPPALASTSHATVAENQSQVLDGPVSTKSNAESNASAPQSPRSPHTAETLRHVYSNAAIRGDQNPEESPPLAVAAQSRQQAPSESTVYSTPEPERAESAASKDNASTKLGKAGPADAPKDTESNAYSSPDPDEEGFEDEAADFEDDDASDAADNDARADRPTESSQTENYSSPDPDEQESNSKKDDGGYTDDEQPYDDDDDEGFASDFEEENGPSAAANDKGEADEEEPGQGDSYDEEYGWDDESGVASVNASPRAKEGQKKGEYSQDFEPEESVASDFEDDDD